MAPLYIVGTGPGAPSHLTDAAKEAIAASDVIIGYGNYVELVRPLLDGKQVLSTGMMQEVQRCREAIRRACAGEAVALVSGGDSGIYGMAGLVLELVEADAVQNPGVPGPEVIVIPGISAVQAAASLLGAPLMHDFAVISLSDLLTPWELIKTRLDAAARADFVVAIYNPRSKTRRMQIEEAQRILLGYRSPKTPTGIVRNACRDGQEVVVTTLGELLDHEIDMTSIVLVGNASSFIDSEGRIVTPRGYAGKYGQAATTADAHPDQGALFRPGALMFCGTASDVGKSIITSGFCRCLVKRGISVAPFKSQNMSLNSFVTPEGGEIGRAQAVQAEACGINPHTDMNPVLLKPNSDTGSQIVVQGRPVANMSVSQYDAYKPAAFEKIRESFGRLRQSFEFIAIEGAGSISEINLKKNDIANLKIAEMAQCPVILVADIDRGGVFAQIAGTIDLLEPSERARVKGVIINKFRGDASILKPGIDFIQQRTGIPVLGILPWFKDIRLPDEDSASLGKRTGGTGITPPHAKIAIGVIRLPRISNFSDFDPLQNEADVHLTYIESPDQLHGLDILIIPGSKSTIGDLNFLMERGLFDAIRLFKGHIVGICGGFQMLGTTVLDPDGVESAVKEAQGLNLLPSTTVLLPEKETHQVLAYLGDGGLSVAPDCSGVISGYEIHMGVTVPEEGLQPFSRIFRRGDMSVAVAEGAVSGDGRVFGTYLHGLFENSRFRETFLNGVRREKGMPLGSETLKQSLLDPFDQLAEQLETHLDLPRILAMCGLNSILPDPLFIFLALLLDLLMGDPHWLPHPVVAIGRLISLLDSGLRRSWLNERLAGVLLLCLVVGIAAGATWFLLHLVTRLMPLLGWIAAILVSSTCLAARSLHVESARVADALAAGDLAAARRYLSYIVGRDTEQLEEPEIWRAVVETVAENSSDGIIAPLFWLTIGGPVAAMAFKAVSTLDSMVGYKNKRYLRLGWASARMDDLLNYLPARLTALLLVISAPLAGCSATGAARITIRDRRKHPSPNSGYPEAAAAGALGVRLGGDASYSGVPSRKEYLGDPLHPLDERAYRSMIKLMYISTLLMAAVCMIAAFCLRGFRVPFL